VSVGFLEHGHPRIRLERDAEGLAGSKSEVALGLFHIPSRHVVQINWPAMGIPNFVGTRKRYRLRRLYRSCRRLDPGKAVRRFFLNSSISKAAKLIGRRRVLGHLESIELDSIRVDGLDGYFVSIEFDSVSDARPYWTRCSSRFLDL